MYVLFSKPIVKKLKSWKLMGILKKSLTFGNHIGDHNSKIVMLRISG
jgi:hypothetical protein